ncbi:Vacuolar_membrane protein [Hexamita inflata]|uniref:Vacuolar membrane protein n=1 Tax=Hexamita inflata TaxID=28002 RepID=A0AA86P228_9EUKA|nr:Vacuolar membrane protein [Hexamita inflata]
MTEQTEFKLDFDLEQFNIDVSEDEHENILISSQVDDNNFKTMQKDILSFGDTHILQNTDDLKQFVPYYIQKVATSQNVTVVAIGCQHQVKLLRYDQTFRTTDYQKYFEVLDIQLKASELHLRVEQIYISLSGQYAVIVFETGLVFITYTGTSKSKQTQSLLLTKDSSQRLEITSCCFNEGQNEVEVLFGTRYSKIYSSVISMRDKKLSIEGNNGQPKLVHCLSQDNKITGLDFQYFTPEASLQEIIQELGPSSAINQQKLMDSLQLNYQYPNNMCDYKYTETRFYIILISSQQGIIILMGRGFSAGDVLLLSNDLGQLTKSLNKYQLSDELPTNYSFLASVPFPSELNIERSGFFKRNELRQAIGWIWFSGLLHVSQNKLFQDVIYEEEEQMQNDFTNGWEEKQERIVSHSEAKDVFSYTKVKNSIAIQCFVGQLPLDIEKIYKTCLNGIPNLDKSSYLAAEQTFVEQILEKISQSQSIMDTNTVKEAAPTAVLYGQHQYVVSYPDELISVSQITLQCSAKVQSEELVLNLMKSNDPVINFNLHNDKELEQICIGFASDILQKKCFVYSKDHVYQLYFNDQKDMWKDMMVKNMFAEALEATETQKQVQEVKYYQGLNNLQQQNYTEAALILGKTPRQISDLMTEFISTQKHRGFTGFQLGSGRSVMELYEHREALILLIENRLSLIDVQQQQKLYNDSIQAVKLFKKNKKVDLDEQDLNAVLAFRQTQALIFVAIQQYLSLINDLYFSALSSDNDTPFIDFNIVPTKKQLKMARDFRLDCFRQQQQLSLMKQRIPGLNQKLVNFIQKYAKIVPIQISRSLLTLSSNQYAYEALTRSIDDAQGLLSFYLKEMVVQQKLLDKGKIQTEIVTQNISQYENKLQHINNLFRYENSFNYLKEQTFDLLRQVNVQKQLQIYYQNAFTLFKLCADETKQLLYELCSQFREEIEPLQFLPTLIQALDLNNQMDIRQAITQFMFLVSSEYGWTQMSIQNLLVNILSANAQCPMFTDYLCAVCRLPKEQQNFTYSYALRCVTFHNQHLAKVYLLQTNSQFEQAVELALKLGNYELAKEVSFSAPEDEINGLLQLVALHMSKQRTIQEALKFVNVGGVRRVRVENLLLQVPVLVDQQLKQEIKASMSEYQSSTEQLRIQIETSNSSTKQIQFDIDKLRKRFMYVRKSQICSFCGNQLMTEPFLQFGCGHGFHSRCMCQIIKLKGTGVEKRQLDKILKQMNEIVVKYQSNDEQSFQTEDQNTYIGLNNQLEQILSAECLYCAGEDLNGQWLQVGSEWAL